MKEIYKDEWLVCWPRELEIWVQSLLVEVTSKTEKIFKDGWLVCWSIKLETWVSISTSEDTSKTESRRYWFCRRGYLFNREEKSDSGCLGDVEDRFVQGPRFWKVLRTMV